MTQLQIIDPPATKPTHHHPAPSIRELMGDLVVAVADETGHDVTWAARQLAVVGASEAERIIARRR